MITSIFPVLCTDDLDASRDFYCALLDLTPIFECGWYTALGDADDPSTQLIAFVLPGHESVPEGHRVRAAGMLATFEVDDVDAVHARAVALGLTPALELCDEEFGQRHFMVEDPGGVLVDVVQTIPPSREFLRDVARWRRANR